MTSSTSAPPSRRPPLFARGRGVPNSGDCGAPLASASPYGGDAHAAVATRLRPRSRAPSDCSPHLVSTASSAPSGHDATDFRPPNHVHAEQAMRRCRPQPHLQAPLLATPSRKRKAPSSGTSDAREFGADDDGEHSPASASENEADADADEGCSSSSSDDDGSQTSSRITRKLHRFSKLQRERLELVLTQSNMYPNKHWNLVDAALHVPPASTSASAVGVTLRQSRAAERRIVDNLARVLGMERKNICNWFQNKRSATRKFLKKIGCDADLFMQKCRDTHDRRIDHPMLMHLCQKVNFASQEAAPPTAQVREEICALLAAHNMYWPRKGWKPPPNNTTANANPPKRRRLNTSASAPSNSTASASSRRPSSGHLSAPALTLPASASGSLSPSASPSASVSPQMSSRRIATDPSAHALSTMQTSPSQQHHLYPPPVGVADLSPLASPCDSPQFSRSPSIPRTFAVGAPTNTAVAAVSSASDTALRKAQLEAAVRHIQELLASRLLAAQRGFATAAAGHGGADVLAAAAAAGSSPSFVDQMPPLPPMPAQTPMYITDDFAKQHAPGPITLTPKDEFLSHSHSHSGTSVPGTFDPSQSNPSFASLGGSMFQGGGGVMPPSISAPLSFQSPKFAMPNTPIDLAGAYAANAFGMSSAMLSDLDPL